MSDGTGTENKTSSENERHVTYAGTDSMYDDPPQKIQSCRTSKK